MKTFVKHLLRNVGFDIVSSHPNFNQKSRKNQLLSKYKIAEVLDVGANSGQFGRELRKLGYTKNIHSFEPISKVFTALSATAKRDPNWFVYNYGMGASDDSVEINISNNLVSSSIRQMLSTHLTAHPESKTVSKEFIQVHTVEDFLVDKQWERKHNLMLKIDTQGYESDVLYGTGSLLKNFAVVAMELSIDKLYEGQATMTELVDYMYNAGYYLTIIEPCDTNYQNWELLQVDGWFVKR